MGHDVGDDVLSWIGRILMEHTRVADVPFRIGGEEFAVLCPATSAELARDVAQRLVDVVGEAKPPSGHEQHVTMSAGYGTCPEHGETTESLYNAADQALLQAKREGRSRVVAPNPPSPQLNQVVKRSSAARRSGSRSSTGRNGSFPRRFMRLGRLWMV